MRITAETAHQPSKSNNYQDYLELPTPKRLGFGVIRLFVTRRIYDEFVAWSREDMLRYGLALDETVRLARLITDASGALCFGGGCFVTRAVNIQEHPDEKRYVLTLRRKLISLSEKNYLAWVIEP